MNLNFWKQFLPGVVLTLAIGGIANADIVFTFTNNGDLDSEAIGSTLSATDGIDTVTLTTIDIVVPNIIETSPDVFEIDSETPFISNGDLRIDGNNQLSFNNLNIGNGDYDTFAGSNVPNESANINDGESWIFSFDTDVTIDQFRLASADPGAGLIISTASATSGLIDIGALSGPTPGLDDPSSTPERALVNDPLSGLVIAAGTSITFEAVGDVAATNYRIEAFTVSAVAVPEPCSIALLGVLGLGAIARRRR